LFAFLMLLVALLVGLGIYPQPVLDVSGMTGTLLQPDSALAITGQP
jgi:NADH-quinone oxidoreductase subunit M